MRHGDEIEEWFEALINIIKVWVWGLWESEGGLSIMELHHSVVRLIDVLSQLKGCSDQILHLIKLSEFFDLFKVLLVESNLLGECFFLSFQLSTEEVVLILSHILTIGKASLDLKWPNFHIPETLNVKLFVHEGEFLEHQVVLVHLFELLGKSLNSGWGLSDEVLGCNELFLVDWVMEDLLLHLIVDLEHVGNRLCAETVGSVKDHVFPLESLVSELSLELLGHHSEDSEVNLVL